MLANWGWVIGQVVTPDWQAWVGTALDTDSDARIEIWATDRVLTLNLHPLGPQPYVNVYGHDITQLRRAEQALRENEQRMRVALSGVNIAVFHQDRALRYTWIYQPQLGYRPEQVVGHNDAELLPAEAARRMTQIKQRVVETGVSAREQVSVAAQGGQFIYDLVAEPLRSANGAILGLTGATFDITERVQAEEALRASEQRYRGLFESSPIAMWEEDHSLVKQRLDALRREGDLDLADLDLADLFQQHPKWVAECAGLVKILDANRAALQLFRAGSPADMLNGWLQGIGSGANETFVRQLVKMANGEMDLEEEGRFQAATGEHVHVRLHWSPLPGQEQTLTRCIVTAVDLTERQLAQERLAYQARLLDNVHDAVVGLDDHFIVTSWNRDAEQLYGWTAAEAIGRLGREVIHTETTAAEQAAISRMLGETDHFRGEVVHHRRDGTRLHIEAATVALRDRAGRVSGYVSAYRDVSEQEQAESELRRQNEILQLIFDQIPVMINFTGPDGRIKFVNREWERRLGWTRAELEQRYLDEVLAEEYPDLQTRQRARDLIEAGQSGWVDFEMRARDGRVLETSWADVKLSDGTVIGFGQDITARKQAEAMQARLAAIVQDTDDAVYSKSLDGTLLTWNAGAERLYGYTADEVVGRSVSILFPAHQAEELAGILARIRRGERTRHYETTRIRKDGTPIEVSETISPIRDASGQIAGASAIARDISERKQAETALQQANERLRALTARLSNVQEVERQALARELHDQVGQNLTALNINLNIFRTQLPPGAAQLLDQRLADSLALLRETTARTREVMVELHPPLLDEYGLITALRAHVDRLTQRLNLAIAVTGDEPAPRLPAPVEMALFRIAQEALNNIAKHARATRASLTLESFPAGIGLTIADDGVGFDPSARRQPDGHSGWGLITMRERAEAAGGRLQVETRPGQGTRIVVEMAR